MPLLHALGNLRALARHGGFQTFQEIKRQEISDDLCRPIVCADTLWCSTMIYGHEQHSSPSAPTRRAIDYYDAARDKSTE